MKNETPIDQLTNRELDEAVAIRLGWKRYRFQWNGPNSKPLREASDWYRCLPHYSTDINLAMGLLVDLSTPVAMFIDDKIVEIVDYRTGDDDSGRVLASGPKSELPRLCCVAFLKLKDNT